MKPTQTIAAIAVFASTFTFAAECPSEGKCKTSKCTIMIESVNQKPRSVIANAAVNGPTFVATIKQDLTINGNTVLPTGTKLMGNKRGTEILFNSAVLPDGHAITFEGGMKGKLEA